MPTFKDCASILLKAAGEGILTEKQANDVVQEIADFIKAKKSVVNAADIDIEVMKHIKQLGQEALLAAAIERRNSIINLVAKNKFLSYVSKFGDNPALGVKAYMGGTVKLFEGGRLSIDALGRSLALKYTGRLVDDLEKLGVFEIFTTGNLDQEIAREMWEMRPNGNPGITGSKEARTIAEVIHKWQSIAVDRQNRAGAYILKRPGYIVRQSHDLVKIRRAGFEVWRDAIINRLDHDETFKGADPNEFLKAAWEALQTGMHLRARGEAESNFLQGFTGPANLAKKLSAERLLHFKSADDWFAYNLEFGTGNLREAVVYGLDHAARNTALMEGLGTNPLSTLDSALKQLKYLHREDPVKFDALNSKTIHNLFKEIEGTSRIPAHLSSARISAGIRSIINMAKLGGATLSSFADIPFQVSELRYQGHSVFSAYGNALTNIFRGRGDAETRHIARLIGVGFDGIIGDIMSRYNPGDHVPGMLSKTQQRFFKLNLLTWWNDAHRTGVARMMSTELAAKTNTAFNDLDEATRRLFEQYDIREQHWELIRKYAVSNHDGTKFVTPDGLADASDEDIAKAYGLDVTKKKAIAAARDRLENQLQAYFIDRADFSVPVPGASERAMMHQGTQPGTAVGEALRFIMQFKAFPISAIHRTVGRELYGKGANSITEALFKGKGDLVGLAHLIAATTLFGYLSMMAKDIAKGREPRKMNSEKVVLAAMAQGGGLGIYGDFLFGEYQKYGRSALGTLAGPTISQTEDLFTIWSQAIRGEEVGAESMRLLMNNVPFINLFYTRAALDYLILYQLQEMSNPGYLTRMEARMLRENEQRFFVPPSSVIPYGGGDQPFEALQ